MECAAKGSRRRCSGSGSRRCGGCGAVVYCSLSHQISHWSVHKEECGRLKQQLCCVEMLNDFPFTFSSEATYEVCEMGKTRCAFLNKLGIHRVGIWTFECSCEASSTLLDNLRFEKSWNLSSRLCPCRGPLSILKKQLSSWNDYYEWRGIPLDSPVALLLHWPLTIYQAIQLASANQLIPETTDALCIHYLGPEKELYQSAVFGELHALLPGVQLHIDFVGPAVPHNSHIQRKPLLNYIEEGFSLDMTAQNKCKRRYGYDDMDKVYHTTSQETDGETINVCSFAHCMDANCSCKYGKGESGSHTTEKSSVITLRLHSGYYHDRYKELTKKFLPDLIIAPNAGIAAYKSWLPTIELIRETEIPAIFSDYCEEACNLATNCISSVTSSPLTIPVQLNPFRHPLAVEDSALLLPCYSNCFLYGL